MPPTSAKASATPSDTSALLDAGAAAAPAAEDVDAPATTLPASGTSIVAALRPPNPLLALSTPATRVKSPTRWLATGNVNFRVEPSRARTCGALASTLPSLNGKKRTSPASPAPERAVRVRSISAPWPVAAASQPSSGRGSAARVRSIGPAQRGSGAAPFATGSVSDRSAPSGMQISLHTSQSARAFRLTVLPLRKSGTATISVSSSTSPS